MNTCNEKAVVAARASEVVSRLQPTPPALRLFDAGMGDATVLVRLIRNVHRFFPTVPLLAVAKEISLEDVRLGLEKMPDRFHEHPATVLVITNLSYADAPGLMPGDPALAESLNWHEVRLSGRSAAEFDEQIAALGPVLDHGWQAKPSPQTGNPTYVRPSILVIYRADYEFLLDTVIPAPGRPPRDYDFVLASQPWRARMPASFKAEKVLAPLVRSLGPGGKLLAIQSYGEDPALEVVQRIWPDENPFQVRRHELLAALDARAGPDAARFELTPPPRASRCSGTRCTRCRRRSATASARRRSSPPGTPPFTSTRSRTSAWSQSSRTARTSTDAGRAAEIQRPLVQRRVVRRHEARPLVTTHRRR